MSSYVQLDFNQKRCLFIFLKGGTKMERVKNTLRKTQEKERKKLIISRHVWKINEVVLANTKWCLITEEITTFLSIEANFKKSFIQVYTYVYVCIYIYVYKYLYKYVHIHIYTFVYIHIWMHMYVFMTTYKYRYVVNKSLRSSVFLISNHCYHINII
jgi:hypothetical protein